MHWHFSFGFFFVSFLRSALVSTTKQNIILAKMWVLELFAFHAIETDIRACAVTTSQHVLHLIQFLFSHICYFYRAMQCFNWFKWNLCLYSHGIAHYLGNENVFFYIYLPSKNFVLKMIFIGKPLTFARKKSKPTATTCLLILCAMCTFMWCVRVFCCQYLWVVFVDFEPLSKHHFPE